MDGVLARAIMHGGWVLMDNANLCNPTVLDRLNPLLEPNGELWLSFFKLAVFYGGWDTTCATSLLDCLNSLLEPNGEAAALLSFFVFCFVSVLCVTPIWVFCLSAVPLSCTESLLLVCAALFP